MKSWILLLMLLPAIGFSENQNKTLYENRYLFEATGLLNFETYGENIYTNNSFEFGVNPLPVMNVAVSTSIAYRNYSSRLKTLLSVNYCFLVDRFEIRAGGLGGVSSLVVGRYCDNSPAFGAQAIFGVRLTPNVSVRMQHRSIWHLEEHTVYGSELLVGITYSFKKIPARLANRTNE
jgi:hypothetical protein